MDAIFWVIVGLGLLLVYSFESLRRNRLKQKQLSCLLQEQAGDGDILCKKPLRGAAVGALSGKSRTGNAVPKDVRLRLIIDSDRFPLFEIPFIEATSSGVTDGRAAMREADEWLARVRVMMHRVGTDAG